MLSALYHKNKIVCSAMMDGFFSVFQKKYYPLANINKDSEVLILGNGPSLNELDLLRVNRKKYTVVCVNFFPLKNDKFKVVKPEYLCLIDPHFFTPQNEQKFDDLYKVLSEVDWKLKIICLRGQQLWNVKNPNISYFWINNVCNTYEDCSSKFIYGLYKYNFANFGLQNVVLGALYFSISSGARKIYLAGVDMSEFVGIKVGIDNELYVDTNHSYGKGKMTYGEKSLYLNIHNLLGAYQKMFAQFYAARKYSDYMNCEVINLSLYSFIDVFEKKKCDVIY